MSRLVPFVPLGVVAALVLLPATQASHLSMDMPGLGGAAVSPPSFLLLAMTALAALLQGGWLLRTKARDAGWALALTPLAVSAARALSVEARGDLIARIAGVGAAGSEHMWALLCAIALVVGFGAARVLEAGSKWQQSEPRQRPAVLRAVSAFALALPFVALIVLTSTGLDWISSWIRWGGCGLALGVCAAGALLPRRSDARLVGGITFALAVALSLLTEHEYVEALAHDAIAHRDPFDPAIEWVRGVQEIAIAVEPRARHGPWLALLPWLALGAGARWRQALPRLASGAALLFTGVLASSAISSTLDARAVQAAGIAVTPALEEPEEIRWSTRVLPRTAPWLRALSAPPERAPEPTPEPVRCAAWMAPPVGG